MLNRFETVILVETRTKVDLILLHSFHQCFHYRCIHRHRMAGGFEWIFLQLVFFQLVFFFPFRRHECHSFTWFPFECQWYDGKFNIDFFFMIYEFQCKFIESFRRMKIFFGKSELVLKIKMILLDRMPEMIFGEDSFNSKEFSSHRNSILKANGNFPVDTLRHLGPVPVWNPVRH